METKTTEHFSVVIKELEYLSPFPPTKLFKACTIKERGYTNDCADVRI